MISRFKFKSSLSCSKQWEEKKKIHKKALVKEIEKKGKHKSKAITTWQDTIKRYNEHFENKKYAHQNLPLEYKKWCSISRNLDTLLYF